MHLLDGNNKSVHYLCLQNRQLKQDMQALLLSFLYLYANPKTTEVGAGDLLTSNLQTGLSKGNGKGSAFLNSSHALLSSLYNDLVKGTLPGFSMNLPTFFFNNIEAQYQDLISDNFNYASRSVMILRKILNDIVSTSDESLVNYHYLWYSYINGRHNVTIICDGAYTDCKEYIFSDNQMNTYIISKKNYHFELIEKLRNNTANGTFLEGYLNGHPCLDQKIIDTFKIKEICQFVKSISENSNQFLKMMKYIIQSPVFIEEDEEYLSIFKHANSTLQEKGYFLKENKV